MVNLSVEAFLVYAKLENVLPMISNNSTMDRIENHGLMTNIGGVYICSCCFLSHLKELKIDLNLALIRINRRVSLDIWGTIRSVVSVQSKSRPRWSKPILLLYCLRSAQAQKLHIWQNYFYWASFCIPEEQQRPTAHKVVKAFIVSCKSLGRWVMSMNSEYVVESNY